mmetsp:Transcript_134964/g.262825  ORF Transcript_134964/g.262825 Transcript_134964/m.262825 type:complete len:257 (-) Transcript_134964:206-976(-)
MASADINFENNNMIVCPRTDIDIAAVLADKDLTKTRMGGTAACHTIRESINGLLLLQLPDTWIPIANYDVAIKLAKNVCPIPKWMEIHVPWTSTLAQKKVSLAIECTDEAAFERVKFVNPNTVCSKITCEGPSPSFGVNADLVGMTRLLPITQFRFVLHPVQLGVGCITERAVGIDWQDCQNLAVVICHQRPPSIRCQLQKMTLAKRAGAAEQGEGTIFSNSECMSTMVASHSIHAAVVRMLCQPSYMKSKLQHSS